MMRIIPKLTGKLITITGIALMLVLSSLATSQDSAPPDMVSEPTIKVVYPRDSQAIGPVDSTFILGSVPPGTSLEINGHEVAVHRTGGFLAYLPVSPGSFLFNLRAQSAHGLDSLIVPVTIADPQPIPPESGARIESGSVRPLWSRTIRSLDEIDVGFDGTIGCIARFWIAGPTDTLGPYPMTELRRERLSDFRSYRRDALYENDKLPTENGAEPSRGRYHGVWRVPPGLATDSLAVVVELRGLTARAVESHRPWPSGLYGPPTPPDTSTEAVTDTARGILTPVDHLPPRVVELTDSVQILRMGPRLGYLTIFQPYGVRARWWGETGPWTILQPVPGYEAWVETEKTRILPEGTPQPGSYIARLSTRSTDHSVSLTVGTQERLPFKVTVADDLRSVQIIIFGATSNTDWIEQDPADDLIENIRWSQVQPHVYEIDLRLTQPLWGYDARYDERRFVIEFRRPPVPRLGLGGVTIAVDAGHSSDPGAIGPTGVMEKDANLRLAIALRRYLRDAGARVVMTRLGDEHVPLYDRPSMAVSQQADLFISVHNNAVPDGVNPRRHNGSGTYYYHPFSRDFARHVHQRLVGATHLDDYGLTQGNFAVIRPTQYPSILLECAFIILPEQEEMLTDEEFIDHTARGIAEGVYNFVRARLD